MAMHCRPDDGLARLSAIGVICHRSVMWNCRTLEDRTVRTASYTSFFKKKSDFSCSNKFVDCELFANRRFNRKNASRIEAQYKRLLKKTGNRYTR
jgi:hypothetical protein